MKRGLRRAATQWQTGLKWSWWNWITPPVPYECCRKQDSSLIWRSTCYMLRVWGYGTHIRHAPKGVEEERRIRPAHQHTGPFRCKKSTQATRHRRCLTRVLPPPVTPDQALGSPPGVDKPVNPSASGKKRGPTHPRRQVPKSREEETASRRFNRKWRLPSGAVDA